MTALVHEGANELEVLLGNGWFRGRLGWGHRRALYGDRLALLAQLEVTTSDGRVHVLATDGSWTVRESGVLADDLYDGQRTDLRVEPAARTGAVEVVDADLARLVAPAGPPVRVTETLPAVEVSRSPSGATLVDFGQNLVGWVRLRVRDQAAGTEVVIRHAEVLEHGELGVRPLRTAKATDSYLLAGARRGGARAAASRSTASATPRSAACRTSVAEDVEAVVVGSDLRRTGWFESSSDLLDRFHENVVWSMRGNFLDVPTDCPQRDERLGWTGDIQVFAPTAMFLYDSAGFLESWLADLAAEQKPDGSVPYVVPDVLRTPEPTAAGWGDAATIVPWVLYERSGDAAVLARQLPSMRAWVDKIAGPGRAGPPVDRRLPVRRLARPDGAAGPAGQGAGRSRRRRHGLPRPLGGARRGGGAAARRSSMSPTPTRGSPTRSAAPSRASTSRPAAACSATPRPPTRSRSRWRCCRPASSATGPGSGWPTSCAPPATASAPGSSARR